jgi:hypothetical protein
MSKSYTKPARSSVRVELTQTPERTTAMMRSSETFVAWARAAVLAAGLSVLAADRAGAQYGYISAGYPVAGGFTYPDFTGFANVNQFGSVTPLAAMMYGGPGGGMGWGGYGAWGSGYGTGYWGGGFGMYGMSQKLKPRPARADRP